MILGVLSAKDIVYAAIIAFFLTYVILKVSNAIAEIRKALKESEHQFMDIENILEKYYKFFPGKVFNFNGEIIERGMFIRIKTKQNKTFEGKFLGYDNENTVCLMTKKYFITYTINNIVEIEQID